jgi:putative heme iron utilization protein
MAVTTSAEQGTVLAVRPPSTQQTEPTAVAVAVAARRRALIQATAALAPNGQLMDQAVAAVAMRQATQTRQEPQVGSMAGLAVRKVHLLRHLALLGRRG